MRTVMPALQRAKSVTPAEDGLRYQNVSPPKQQRQTRIVKDRTVDEIAQEIAEWITEK